MIKTLEMTFRDVVGKSVVISLPNPKDEITLAEVTAVMQSILAKNIFYTSSGNLEDIVDAKIRVIDVTVLS